MHAGTFEEIVGAELTALQRRAVRLTHDREVAEDLVQDTLERAYRKFALFQPGTNFRAWLFRVMRNIWIGDYRRQTSAPRTVPLEEFEEARQQYPGGYPLSVDDVEAVVVDELSAASIHLAIDRLPVRIRQVVVLADVENTPYGTIAESLAIPIGTVASRLSRGRRRLQRALAEQDLAAGYLAKAG